MFKFTNHDNYNHHIEISDKIDHSNYKSVTIITTFDNATNKHNQTKYQMFVTNEELSNLAQYLINNTGS